MRLAATLALITCLCAAWPASAIDNPLVVELWPGSVPDEVGDIGAEKIVMSPQLDRKQVEVTYLALKRAGGVARLCHGRSRLRRPSG